MAWNDKCDLIPDVTTEVTVLYNLESREYNEKWYTDAVVFDIKIEQGEFKKEKKAPVKSAPPVKPGMGLDKEDEGDDLPF